MSLLAHKRRRRPELNLVPLIDVLVMLIFFAFVTMQFKSAATLNITLPKAETAGKNEFKGRVTIAIDKDGKISFNGKLVTDYDGVSPVPPKKGKYEPERGPRPDAGFIAIQHHGGAETLWFKEITLIQ